MYLFKKKNVIDINRLIDGELALARRGRYSFGVIVTKSGNSKKNIEVQRLLESRVRSYDFVVQINSKSCIVLLRKVMSSDIENIAIYVKENIEGIKVDCYVFPCADDNIKNVLNCKECMDNISFSKRCCDVFLSLIVMVFLFPLYIIVAIVIKISSPGSVFFVQERIGYMGKKFLMYKFRTMHENVSQDEHVSYLKEIIKDSKSNNRRMNGMEKKENSKRIFPAGRFLRKYCIDEMPQFFNILKGDMSVVGPRPPVQYEVDEYEEWYKERFDVYPGLTGLWQISGKNNLSFEKMIKLDILYKKKWNIVKDIKIIIMTPVVILKQYI